VNHFKSKRCGNADGANRAQDDGQGCWNPVRIEAANNLVEWAKALAAEHGDDKLLLLGDFNAYAREDPMVRLREAGFRNALRVIIPCRPAVISTAQNRERSTIF